MMILDPKSKKAQVNSKPSFVSAPHEASQKMIIYLDSMLPSNSSDGRVGRRVPRFPTLHPVLQSKRVCHASASRRRERCSLVSRTKHHLSFHLSPRSRIPLPIHRDRDNRFAVSIVSVVLSLESLRVAVSHSP